MDSTIPGQSPPSPGLRALALLAVLQVRVTDLEEAHLMVLRQQSLIADAIARMTGEPRPAHRTAACRARLPRHRGAQQCPRAAR